MNSKSSVFSTFWIKNFWTFCLLLGPTLSGEAWQKGKRNIMQATMYVDSHFFFKRLQCDIFCWLYWSLCQTYLLITSPLFIYHHGLWFFRRILNIVIILAIVQARQIRESKSSAESGVLWISPGFSATYLWKTIKYFGFCASQTNKVVPVL